MEAGRVRYDVRPPAPSSLAPEGLTARVALVPVVVGDDGTMLDLARPKHDGVVIESFGSGNVPPGAVPAIGRWLEEGKPVVLASRCLYGTVVPTYAFDGGGARTTAIGAIPAGPRTPSQARMELTIALCFRSLRHSLFEAPPHRWLVLSILGALAATWALVQSPTVRAAFGITLPTLADLVLVAAASAIVLVAVEITKALLKRAAKQSPVVAPAGRTPP